VEVLEERTNTNTHALSTDTEASRTESHGPKSSSSVVEVSEERTNTNIHAQSTHIKPEASRKERHGTNSSSSAVEASEERTNTNIHAHETHDTNTRASESNDTNSHAYEIHDTNSIRHGLNSSSSAVVVSEESRNTNTHAHEAHDTSSLTHETNDTNTHTHEIQNEPAPDSSASPDSDLADPLPRRTKRVIASGLAPDSSGSPDSDLADPLPRRTKRVIASPDISEAACRHSNTSGDSGEFLHVDSMITMHKESFSEESNNSDAVTVRPMTDLAGNNNLVRNTRNSTQDSTEFHFHTNSIDTNQDESIVKIGGQTHKESHTLNAYGDRNHWGHQGEDDNVSVGSGSGNVLYMSRLRYRTSSLDSKNRSAPVRNNTTDIRGMMRSSRESTSVYYQAESQTQTQTQFEFDSSSVRPPRNSATSVAQSSLGNQSPLGRSKTITGVYACMCACMYVSWCPRRNSATSMVQSSLENQSSLRRSKTITGVYACMYYMIHVCMYVCM
jgi:hypothetical protein